LASAKNINNYNRISLILLDFLSYKNQGVSIFPQQFTLSVMNIIMWGAIWQDLGMLGWISLYPQIYLFKTTLINP
jgi:hypothetical protein